MKKLNLFWCVWGGLYHIREAMGSALITKKVNEQTNPNFNYFIIINEGRLYEKINKKELDYFHKKTGISFKFINYKFENYPFQYHIDFYRLREMSRFSGPTVYLDSDCFCIKPINIEDPIFQNESDAVFFHKGFQQQDYPLGVVRQYYKDNKFYLHSDENNNMYPINFGLFYCKDPKKVESLFETFKLEIDKILDFSLHEIPIYTYNEFILTYLYLSNSINIFFDNDRIARYTFEDNISSGLLYVDEKDQNVNSIKSLVDYPIFLHSLHHHHKTMAIRFFYDEKKLKIFYSDRKDVFPRPAV